MMNRKPAYLLGAAAGALAAAGSAQASETVRYTYDALGRLVAVKSTGGPNEGVNVGTCYDRAGNRSTYTVGTGGTPPPPCPPPPPSPPPPPPPPPPASSSAVALDRSTADA